MHRKISPKVLCGLLAGVVLIGMSSCMGGDGSDGTPVVRAPDTNITPPGRGGTSQYFGAVITGFRGSNCSSGAAAGIATGYSSRSAAELAALNRCRSAGGQSCQITQALIFGSAYSSQYHCGGLATGYAASRCTIYNGRASSRAAAESSALAKCRARGDSGCTTATSACSVAGPASATNRTFDLGGTGTGTGTGGGNRAPVIARRFADGTVQQGATIRYSSVSASFSDPDSDRLNFSVSSSHPAYATARLSGDEIVITGVQGFTTGAVTITVTARDPAGLSVSQIFSIRVTAPTGGDNRAPVIARRFADGTVQQGATIRYSSVSASFSDPDSDRLNFSVSSSHPAYATARLSGDEIVITGVQGFTTGAVTITVTARDPAGLSVSQIFSIRVTAPADLWAAISVQDLFQNCARRASGSVYDSSSPLAAERAAVSQCNSAATSSTCVGATTWRNGCGAFAQGDRCGGSVSSGHRSLAAAEQAALSSCRSQTTNCRIEVSICTSNVR